jgi:hypothetical protein
MPERNPGRWKLLVVLTLRRQSGDDGLSSQVIGFDTEEDAITAECAIKNDYAYGGIVATVTQSWRPRGDRNA